MKGYWNGTPAKVRGVKYRVGTSKLETHWQQLHIGTIRQGIEVQYHREKFIIDNEHGDGYIKVTEGMGSPSYSHKSVSNPTDVIYIPDEEVIQVYDREGINNESREYDKWVKENYPEVAEKLEALKSIINRGRNAF